MSDEKRFTGEYACGHCENVGVMEIVASFTETQYHPKGDISFDSHTIYNLCKCPACARITLQRHLWADYLDWDEGHFETLYPVKRMLRGLPPQIEKAYKAAIRVRVIDANAYGVLIGRVLDLVCQDRKASGPTLASKLKDLANRNEIPDKLVDVANGLRNLRNVGAHADLGELTEDSLPVLDDLARAILEYVYYAPLLAKEAEQTLEKLRNV